MREFLVEEKLRKALKKLVNKDKPLYTSVMNKFEEILSCKDVNHYKNLRKPLQHLKRSHIKGPFVLTFKYVESEDKVVFYDLDHHGNVYQ